MSTDEYIRMMLQNMQDKLDEIEDRLDRIQQQQLRRVVAMQAAVLGTATAAVIGLIIDFITRGIR